MSLISIRKNFLAKSKILSLLCLGIFIFFAFASVLHHHNDFKAHEDCPVCRLVSSPQVAVAALIVLIAAVFFFSFISLQNFRVPRETFSSFFFSRAPPACFC